MNTTNKATSWLQTLAGQLTALTAVIVAVTGLMAAIRSCDKPSLATRDDNSGRVDPSPPESPAVVSSVDITGKWVDAQNNYILFQQQGKRLTYQSYDASEIVTGRGTGKIDDRTVQLRGVINSQGQAIRYTGQFTLADSDDELTGRLTPNDVLVNLFSIVLFGSDETTLTKE